ncbi:MAG: LapA family protein [Arsenophonus sp.]
MKYFLMILLAIIIFVVSFIFGSHNNQIVTFNYLITKSKYQISTLLSVIFASGFLFGCIICGIFYARLLILLLNRKRKIKKLENQLSELYKNKHDTNV